MSSPIKGPVFATQRVFIKELHFDLKQTQAASPHLNPQMELQFTSNVLEKDVYEVLITLTVLAEQHGKELFKLRVTEAGIFTIQGFEKDQLQHCIQATCPQILYPYLAETVSSTTLRAGFLGITLPFVNFISEPQKQLLEANKPVAK